MAPTNLLRIAVKTLTRLFHLASDKNLSGLNPSHLVNNLMDSNLDDRQNVDQQELLWLNIQDLICTILSRLEFDRDTKLSVVAFFMKFLDQRGFTCNSD